MEKFTTTMRFLEGNKIPYGQDHRFFRGLPANIDFTAEYDYDMTGVWLSAPGYGLQGGSLEDYGNGRIRAYGDVILKKMDALHDEYLDAKA